MTPQLNRFLLSAPFAVLIPGVELMRADPPYGWWHVLVVYLLATLPLSVLLSDRIAAAFRPGWLVVVGGLLILGLGLPTVQAGHELSHWLKYEEPDLFVRQGVIGAWCLLLQLPWCLLGSWVANWSRLDLPRQPPSWQGLVLALVVAATLPSVYLWRVVEKESKKVEELIGQRRLKQALDIVLKLENVGSQRTIAGRSAKEAVIELASQVLPGVSGWRPSGEPVDDAGRMELAQECAAKGFFDDAETLLRPLLNHDPAAALVLASVSKEQQKWKECGQYCRRALALLDRVPPSEAAITGKVLAYHNLAAAAQEQRQYDEARKIYEEAIRRVPPAEAHFHYQLGRLHHLAGRPGKALHHLETARKLDPEGQTEKTQKLLDDIRMHTPGCLLRWFGG